MKIKYKILLIFLGVFLSFSHLGASLNECKPKWNGDWTTTENCIWPDGFKIYGDIFVKDHTIFLGSGTNMGIDLSINKIEFINSSNSKIKLDATAKMANHVTKRYHKVKAFTQGIGAQANVTECPVGMNVFFHQEEPTNPAYHYIIPEGVDAYISGVSGNMYCGIK